MATDFDDWMIMNPATMSEPMGKKSKKKSNKSKSKVKQLGPKVVSQLDLSGAQLDELEEMDELLCDDKNRHLAEELQVEDVLYRFVIPDLEAKKRRPTTINNLKRDVVRFNRWWKSRTDRVLPVGKIRVQHLRVFRRWLSADGASVPMQNNCLRSIRQILNACVSEGILIKAPSLQSLPYVLDEPKIYPSDEEINALWANCHRMTWPVKDGSQRPLHYSPEIAWKVAIVLYRIFGFRTQELIQLERGYEPLRWRNIYGPGLTPNPAGKLHFEFGALVYSPQKQKVKTLYLPLNAHARAAIDLVYPKNHPPGILPILNWSRSSVYLYNAWNRLFEYAGVKPRHDSGVDHYKIKHLRKAANSNANNHIPGSGRYILGHSIDRSSNESVINENHYFNPELVSYRCLMTQPMPTCFDELLSCPIKKAA